MTFRNRLSLTFGVFTVLFCLLFAFLFVESLNLVEEKVIGSLLQQEAKVVQESYERDPGSVALPDLEQLKGYLSGAEPQWLSEYEPGYFDSQDFQVLIVELEPDHLLYLVYDERIGVLDSNEYEIHLAILGMVGIVMMFGFALAWSQARRLSAPLVSLASEMSTESATIDAELLERQDEIGLLSRSYADQMERIDAFIAREQAFTQHVSHELSTPLSIIRTNLELLREPRADADMQRKSVARMEQAIERMQRQIGIFLVLARGVSSTRSKGTPSRRRLRSSRWRSCRRRSLWEARVRTRRQRVAKESPSVDACTRKHSGTVRQHGWNSMGRLHWTSPLCITIARSARNARRGTGSDEAR